MRANKNHAPLALLAAVVSRAAAENPALPQWMPPAPTRGLDPLDRVHLQFSPRPTRSPQVDRNELLRRADSSIGTNTCGFLTDNHSAFPCPEGQTCTNLGSYRGCCRGGDCTTSSFSSVCLDATAEACSSYTAGTMCCTADSEHTSCVTYLWATTATPNQVFSLFVCDTDSWAGQQILDSEPGPVTTTSDEPTTTGPTSSKETSNSPVPTAPSGDKNDNNKDDGGNKSNVGPIVGGVVGGVALVGIIALVGVWIVLRNRKKEKALASNSSSNNANNSYMGGDGSGPPSQAPPPMSMYAPSTYAPSGYQAVSTFGPPGQSPSLQTASVAPGQGVAPYAYQPYPEQSKFGTPPPQGQYGEQGQFGEVADHSQNPNHGSVSEAPTQNPLGMGSNRAELPT